MRGREAGQPVQRQAHLCKIVEESRGVDGGGHKGDGPGVLGRLGREGRQSCPHAVPTCKQHPLSVNTNVVLVFTDKHHICASVRRPPRQHFLNLLLLVGW